MIDQKILVTDDLIVKYRSKWDLNARNWQSEHVRGYVLALSRQLTIAAEMRWQHNITDITALLARYEPLEAVREHDYAGSVLWIAYNWYCARDIVTTRAAIAYALKRWPEDERLLRMLEVVSIAGSGQSGRMSA